MKQIGMRLAMLAVLSVLFAGCSDDDGVRSAAQLEAATVNCNALTNHILTEGPRGSAFTARITPTRGEDWCSFDPASSGALTTQGTVGEPLPIYLQENRSSEFRTAEIAVDYTNGFAAVLRLTQMPYSENPEYDRARGEQPAYRTGSTYIYKNYHTTLIGNRYFSGGRVRNYSVCYDTRTRVSHWVAYPIFYALYEYPVLSRVNAFGYDPNTQPPTIPQSEQQNITSGYGARGYDRGHMLPNASRYNNYETNRMTYYATNMMPQNSQLNQQVWAKLEGKVRQWGPLPRGTRYDTLYVVTGASFRKSTTISNSNGPITVPSHCWKVLLKQTGNQNKPLWELTADEVKAIGFVFTNDAAGAATTVSEAACSVREIEELTGFTFFHNLDPTVAAQVKASYDASQWSGL